MYGFNPGEAVASFRAASDLEVNAERSDLRGSIWSISDSGISSATAMRIRGPIAQQVHPLPEGATIRINVS